MRWFMLLLYLGLFFGMGSYVIYTGYFPFPLGIAFWYMLYVGGGLITAVGQLFGKDNLTYNGQRRWYLDCAFPILWFLFLPLSFAALSVTITYYWLYFVIWTSNKVGIKVYVGSKELTLDWLK